MASITVMTHMKWASTCAILALLLSAVLLSTQVQAHQESREQAVSSDQETLAEDTAVQLSDVWVQALSAMNLGPMTIALSDQASLDLPSGYGFMPQPWARKIMAKVGNQPSADELGVIFPLVEEVEWYVDVEYVASGYIKRSDDQPWDTEQLLAGLRQGTEADNARRGKLGIPPVQVVGWVETPAYDVKLHRLLWAIEARMQTSMRDSASSRESIINASIINESIINESIINYSRHELGREGYIALSLVTSRAFLAQGKRAIDELGAAIEFKEGKRYQDFDAASDRLAEYGLAELIVGRAIREPRPLMVAGSWLAGLWGPLVIVMLLVCWLVGARRRVKKRNRLMSL
ncbi:DUF2167 domain-containing protein [Halomonas binhaiensis]|uniref:DUF2167 domain-containing protein n=1 Tax=Halomonas binhaiensis TaxID=2562282 RepID=A0A5C1NLB7_9GAMM|nr:DUF2167 domain-containing protein [Halomonas binhaiensis]QEM83501.1 DUF2167 domain-containing protein [Halomonas binhaiensis]